MTENIFDSLKTPGYETSCHIKIGGKSFKIESQSKYIYILKKAFKYLLSANAGSNETEIEVGLNDTFNSFDDLIHVAKLSIIKALEPEYYAFHGSCVTKNNRCIAFIGESGSGKTSALIQAILHKYKFICNDTLIISAKDLTVLPFPDFIKIRPDTLKKLTALEYDLSMLFKGDYSKQLRGVSVLDGITLGHYYDKQIKPDSILLLLNNPNRDLNNQINYLILNSYNTFKNNTDTGYNSTKTGLFSLINKMTKELKLKSMSQIHQNTKEFYNEVKKILT